MIISTWIMALRSGMAAAAASASGSASPEPSTGTLLPKVRPRSAWLGKLNWRVTWRSSSAMLFTWTVLRVYADRQEDLMKEVHRAVSKFYQ